MWTRSIHKAPKLGVRRRRAKPCSCHFVTARPWAHRSRTLFFWMNSRRLEITNDVLFDPDSDLENAWINHQCLSDLRKFTYRFGFQASLKNGPIWHPAWIRSSGAEQRWECTLSLGTGPKTPYNLWLGWLRSFQGFGHHCAPGPGTWEVASQIPTDSKTTFHRDSLNSRRNRWSHEVFCA